MRIPAPIRTHRLAAHAAIAVLVATATATGVAFAASGGTKAPALRAGARAPDSIARAAHAALQQLVANGTIDQVQADAIERQVVAGSIDPAALVASGTVNRTQMRAVAHTLRQVKLSMAGSSVNPPEGNKVPSPQDGARASAATVRAARTALQRLVADGTIDQAQAGTIEHQVAAGLIDSRVLVANGTVTQAQMRAVQHALAQVKRSLAPHP